MKNKEVRMETFDNGTIYGFTCINKYDCERFNEHNENPEPDTAPGCVCHYIKEGKHDIVNIRCGHFKAMYHMGSRLMIKCDC